MGAQEEELVVEETNILPFTKAAPKPPGGGNWLGGLGVGAIFLCKKKNLLPHEHHFVLEEFHIINKSKFSILLLTNLNDERYFRVEPEAFCGQFDLVEVLLTGHEAGPRSQP